MSELIKNRFQFINLFINSYKFDIFACLDVKPVLREERTARGFSPMRKMYKFTCGQPPSISTFLGQTALFPPSPHTRVACLFTRSFIWRQKTWYFVCGRNRSIVCTIHLQYAIRVDSMLKYTCGAPFSIKGFLTCDAVPINQFLCMKTTLISERLFY